MRGHWAITTNIAHHRAEHVVFPRARAKLVFLMISPGVALRQL